jgi:hypothetical protein
MSFEAVAKEIVANSIRSAICIDDQFVEPYQEIDSKVNIKDTPKQLTEAFRKSNCTLDIHTYTSYPKLEKEKDFVFNNRDLLILDWELTGDQLKFKDTLKILRDAAESPSLSFVLIYTQQPDLAGIELEIRSFFNSIFKNKKDREDKYEQLLSHLDKEFFSNEEYDVPFDEAESFFEDRRVEIALKEMVSDAHSDEAVKKFKSTIRGCFPDQKTGVEFLKIFEESVKELYLCSGLYEGFEQVEFHNRSTYLSEKEYSSSLYCHKIDHQEHALWVNNTYIIILDKNGIKPDAVYEQFSKRLCSKPGNIMSLIALEMRNNFRENAGKVGKDLLAVDELAFFHHRQSLPDDEDEEFYHFLRNNWKHQVASFHLNSDSKVFPVLSEYIESKKIDEQIGKRLNGNKSDDFQNDLAKLNFQYSFHHAQRKEKDYIRFGDIFSVRESAKSEEVIEYLLNITAQCDCLRPKKIRNYYRFVSGKEEKLKSALEKVDTENHYSFLTRNNKPLCISISWETKPFTIFITEKKRFFSPNKHINVKIEEKTKYLFFEGTLLENYTQRISNQSFAHAARVGVDLAKLNTKK